MSKNLKLFKRITCILGVAFLLMGMVPLPEGAKVTTAAASVKDAEAVSPKALGLPSLHFETNGNAENGEPCDGDNDCKSKNCVSNTCQAAPGDDDDDECTPSGSCPTTCGYDGTDISDGCGGTIACDPVPACGDDDDDEECVYGDWGACSAPCGGGTQTRDLTSGNPGHCKDTEQVCNTQACTGDDDDECLPADANCELDSDCCNGNCNGNKCKDVVSQCKDFGGPCGGNTDCCPGLVCIIGAGPENEKCGYASCTPTKTEADCPDECGLDASEIDDGCGNKIQCAATDECACVPDKTVEDCPDTCGLPASEIDDGCGGKIQCEATGDCQGCEPDGTEICPTACGTPASTPSDGCGGTVQCAATRACGDDDDDDDGNPGGGGSGGGTTPAIIPVTGVDFTIPFAAVQQFSMNLGLMLFGVTMVLEGIDRKRTK